MARRQSAGGQWFCQAETAAGAKAEYTPMGKSDSLVLYPYRYYIFIDKGSREELRRDRSRRRRWQEGTALERKHFARQKLRRVLRIGGHSVVWENWGV